MPESKSETVANTHAVEVFADVWCPFAYVGLTRFLQARDEMAPDLAVVIRAWPLEWVNGAPLDAALVVEEAEDLRHQVAPELFSGVAAEQFPATTILALALTAAGYRHNLTTGETVAMRLRRALFEEGTDISDPAWLAPLAREHGLSLPDPDIARRLVVEDHQRGLTIGVQGSPHFFAGDRSSFCPSLHISRHKGQLQVAADPDRLRQWLSDVLG